jgi:hypothetical protein
MGNAEGLRDFLEDAGAALPQLQGQFQAAAAAVAQQLASLSPEQRRRLLADSGFLSAVELTGRGGGGEGGGEGPAQR